MDQAEALYEAVNQLIRVHQFRDRESICHHNVSVAQCYALETLVKRGSLRLQALADEMYLDKSTTSRVADSLIRKHYVRKIEDPSDRRAVELSLTPEGRALYQQIHAELVAEEASMIEGLSPEVVEGAVALLNKLTLAARQHPETLDDAGRETLIRTIIAGLPGAEEGYTLAQFRAALAAYDGIDAARLRQHLATFFKAIVPVAEEVGIRLAINPDDPPRPMFGLPRVVSSMVDADWLLGVVPSPANGLTFCTGSYGANLEIDLSIMARRFAPHIHFAHLRATGRDSEDKRSFHEAEHLEGDLDMVDIISVLVAEERRRLVSGGAPLPMRPDHGHHILDDARRETRPGYPLYGRMKGLAEIRGLEMAVQRLA